MLLKISQQSNKKTCVGVSFLIYLQASGLNLYKKETPIKVLACEICELFRNDFFTEHLWATASGLISLDFSTY